MGWRYPREQVGAVLPPNFSRGSTGLVLCWSLLSHSVAERRRCDHTSSSHTTMGKPTLSRLPQLPRLRRPPSLARRSCPPPPRAPLPHLHIRVGHVGGVFGVLPLLPRHEAGRRQSEQGLPVEPSNPTTTDVYWYTNHVSSSATKATGSGVSSALHSPAAGSAATT